MRLTFKFLLAFVLALAVALAVTAWRNLERERALFDRDLRHDSLMIGRLVAQSYQHEVRRGDLAAAEAVLVDARNARVGFTVTRVGAGELPAAAAAAIAAGQTVAVRDRHAMSTYLPLDERAALRVTGSLAAEHAYVRQSKQRALLSSLAALGLAAVAVSALGIVLIARPTRALVDKARRVGRGDFAGPLALTQRDELGMLAVEINTMTDRLDQARLTLERESQARVAAVEQLRHADRLMTVGKLAAGIAHELGTPLNVIEGRARMIETGDAEGAEVADSARIIVEQSKRITAIVRQLLDFARRGKSERAPADLVALAGQTAQLLAAAARKADVALTGPAPGRSLYALVDDGQLLQVLTNLVVNALHATPRGGHVAIEVLEVEAAPPGGTTARRACIRVIDDGRGMDPATRERIFEPFFTTKEVGQGTGLGLAVVHGIVADHGGWVEVDSAPGAGSTFSVYLPVA